MKTIIIFILVGTTFNLVAQSSVEEEEFNIGLGWGKIVSRNISTVANLTTGIILEHKIDHIKVKISNGNQDTMFFETACNSVKLYFELKDTLQNITTRTFWDCDHYSGDSKDKLLPNEVAIIHFPIFSQLKGSTTRIKFVTSSQTYYSDWLVI